MQFLSEHIEFLWIIPVIAFVAFIFVIQLVAQKEGVRPQQDLSQEVVRFNTGAHTVIHQTTEQASDRLAQLERAISSVTDSLSVQQRAIEQFHRDNTGHTGEVSDLKNKLRELYKEYDIILSENYSLRAKVKKMQHRPGDPVPAVPEGDQAFVPPSAAPVAVPASPPITSKVDMKLYEDTRTLNVMLLDDTSEIDLSDLTRR